MKKSSIFLLFIGLSVFQSAIKCETVDQFINRLRTVRTPDFYAFLIRLDLRKRESYSMEDAAKEVLSGSLSCIKNYLERHHSTCSVCLGCYILEYSSGHERGFVSSVDLDVCSVDRDARGNKYLHHADTGTLCSPEELEARIQALTLELER